ncbi:MAG: PIG-L family deacetylase [Pyrinomonadaceae bacterium]
MAANTKRVLAVGAHPDDVEIMCSGTLFLLKPLGYEIHVASLTLGDCGSNEHSAEAISRMRHEEAQAACTVLGAVYHCAGFSDLNIFNDDTGNRRVTALLRNVDPSIVFAHSSEDYISDHETASLLVRNACFYASVPNYKTRNLTPAGHSAAVPYLYYAQPMENTDIFGKRITPQFYVDIGDFMRHKIEMLSCHESQRKWLLEHHGMDEYVESVRCGNASLAERASQVSETAINFAEGFRQHLGHAYPPDNILAMLLLDKVILEPEY